MKKLLFALIMMLPNVAFSQIIYNKMENDSTRLKLAGMTTCRSFTDSQVLNVGVEQVIVNEADTAYFVAICINMMGAASIPDDGRMLLRTKSGEVIELYNSASTKFQMVKDYGTTTTAYTVGRYITVKSQKNSLTVNQVIGYYPVEESTLTKLFDGVTKVRIELTVKKYEKEFGKDKVGKELEKHYIELKTDSFRDNF